MLIIVDVNMYGICTDGQKRGGAPINFNTNCSREIKLLPINCLLQFHTLNVFLGIRLHAESLSNIIFFNVNPQIWLRNRKFHYSDCLDRNLHSISDINMRVIRRRNYN